MTERIADFFRYGWPRWWLVRAYNYAPERVGDWLMDFLYPDDLAVTFAEEASKGK